jgi:hypothetical protein
MTALEQVASDEGLGVVRLLLHIGALKLQIKGLEREVEELKARIQALEGSSRP